MAIEVPDGQPTPAAPAPEPGIPAAPTAPTEPTPSPAPQGGRSVDELFNELEELKRNNAELAEKAARAEHEAQYTRNLIETFRQPGQNADAASAGLEITDDEFIDAPGKTLTKALKAIREESRQEMERREKEQFVERAKSQFETGKREATTKLGKLTAGIEQEVASQIRDGIINGAIHPDAATDPDLWAVTAMAYRFKVKGERNFDKYFSTSHAPMTAGHTETPTAGGLPQAAPVLTDEERAAARAFGVSDEQWIKAKQGGAK